jgi:hypothetical protein
MPSPTATSLAVVTVELLDAAAPGPGEVHLRGLSQPIAQPQRRPGRDHGEAPTAPWNTIEEFLAAARKDSGQGERGQCGQRLDLAPGGGRARGQDRREVRPHRRSRAPAPAVLALLGGHIDAVAVSPAEVTTYVQGGKLKVLMP